MSLEQIAKDVFKKAVEPYADGDIDMDFAEVVITSALQQVRDAAKKETVERCAKVAEEIEDRLISPSRIQIIGRIGVSRAIRQMEGGK